MKKVDPQASLTEGWEDAPCPPNPEPMRGPRGAPHPSLCTFGPCVHYHEFILQVDAENPRAFRLPVVLPDGPMITNGTDPAGNPRSMYQPPVTFATERHRHCYPDVGIEMDLGDEPVIRCNRYSMPGGKSAAADIAFDEARREWQAARDAELAEAAEIEKHLNPGETT